MSFIHFTLGNPLITITMMKHNLEAGLVFRGRGYETTKYLTAGLNPPIRTPCAAPPIAG